MTTMVDLYGLARGKHASYFDVRRRRCRRPHRRPHKQQELEFKLTVDFL